MEACRGGSGVFIVSFPLVPAWVRSGFVRVFGRDLKRIELGYWQRKCLVRLLERDLVIFWRLNGAWWQA